MTPAHEPILAGAIGGVLLAMCIEHLTGQRYDRWINREILEPLGVADDCRAHGRRGGCASRARPTAPRSRSRRHQATAAAPQTDTVLPHGLEPGLRRRRHHFGSRPPLRTAILARWTRTDRPLNVSEPTVNDLLGRHEYADPRWSVPVGFGFVRNLSEDFYIRFLPPGGFGFSGNQDGVRVLRPPATTSR